MRAPDWTAGRAYRVPVLALLLALLFIAAGCAGASGGKQSTPVAADPEAQCRAAIAEVNKRCAGEGSDSQACGDAKTHSRDSCIPK